MNIKNKLSKISNINHTRNSSSTSEAVVTYIYKDSDYISVSFSDSFGNKVFVRKLDMRYSSYYPAAAGEMILVKQLSNNKYEVLEAPKSVEYKIKTNSTPHSSGGNLIWV